MCVTHPHYAMFRDAGPGAGRFAAVLEMSVRARCFKTTDTVPNIVSWYPNPIDPVLGFELQ